MLFSKVKDNFDTDVSLIILMDDLEQFKVLAEVILAIGRKRCTYEVYKDEITAYMMELRLPYNRYLKMMRELQKRKWNLKQETKVGLFNRMVKF